MMNDNEIVKAFEHLVKNADNHIPVTGKMLLEDVLDVLYRQKSQIEGLQDEVVTKTDMLNKQKAEMEKFERIVFYGDAVIKKQEADIERYLHSIKLLEKDVADAMYESIKEVAERVEYFTLHEDPEINSLKCHDYDSYIAGFNQCRLQIVKGISKIVNEVVGVDK